MGNCDHFTPISGVMRPYFVTGVWAHRRVFSYQTHGGTFVQVANAHKQVQEDTWDPLVLVLWDIVKAYPGVMHVQSDTGERWGCFMWLVKIHTKKQATTLGIKSQLNWYLHNFWSNSSEITRPGPSKGSWGMEIPLFHGKCLNLARNYHSLSLYLCVFFNFFWWAFYLQNIYLFFSRFVARLIFLTK